MSYPNFNVSAADAVLIAKIVDRAMPRGSSTTRLRLSMDLTACHANGCPLRLEELLKAEAADFAHDINGIAENIDRETGKMGRRFWWPRYSGKG